MSKAPSHCFSTQACLSHLLHIPPHKPEIVQILDFISIPSVLDYTLIDTPKGLSYEGDRLTGLQLCIDLRINEKLTYLSNTNEQTIHAVHYTHLKSVCITLPEQVGTQLTSSLIEANAFAIQPHTEALYTKKIEARALHKCGLLLVHIAFS